MSGDVTLTVSPSFADMPASDWEALAGAGPQAAGAPYNPFVSHAFLSSLEESGCAVRESGWLGQHLFLRSEEGVLLGAVPCYLKSHSQGEYVFDHGWADAFERAGGHYYPKLQVSVPFTPATGPRLLVRDGIAPDAVRHALAEGLKTLTDRLGVSSVHVTFARDEDIAALDDAGFLLRTDQQFHFFNRGYENYDDFLGTLASRKRKALKKERRTALENGIEIEWLTGAGLTEAVWDDFFAFYLDTGSRKWGRPYLNRRFFSLIGERMADDILLVMARREGRYIAGAINFIGSDTLFGRNWGCIEHHPFLHFEVCYHQAIEFAIARGLSTVEAGAQGQHKLARGYEPVTTRSAHYIPHPGLRRAVAQYLELERRDVAEINRVLETHTPFRKG
ncbi:N-acetyltransferase [Nitratireductor aquimarinus]|nr:GNAT family N-acetyltransferase [Nitratireductor aquimarinus]MBN8241431.1 N-acetyltransferase [Nitratireductor aquimarinus]MBY6129817.1 GNAT family N-acetyltransferase [Nitratireductor aquimarinus]MCA1303944.1 GNAT family N-acetyltransferase [Nitratireductor aquimarinus]